MCEMAPSLPSFCYGLASSFRPQPISAIAVGTQRESAVPPQRRLTALSQHWVNTGLFLVSYHNNGNGWHRDFGAVLQLLYLLEVTSPAPLPATAWRH